MRLRRGDRYRGGAFHAEDAQEMWPATYCPDKKGTTKAALAEGDPRDQEEARQRRLPGFEHVQ